MLQKSWHKDYCVKLSTKHQHGIYSGETYTCITGKSHQGNKVSGKVGGTLKRGWTAKTEQEAESGNKNGKNVAEWVNELPIRKRGTIFQVDVTNVVSYASYVEFRTQNKKS